MNCGKDIIGKMKPFYRTGNNNIGMDFFLPCLKYCNMYQRSTGFFTSGTLEHWAAILPRLIKNPDIKIQLLISPQLTEEDKKILRTVSNQEKREIILQKLADQIVMDALEFKNNPTDKKLRKRIFLWLLATDQMEIRFAFPTHIDGEGIFHEKMGIFEFPWGNKIAFTGSANETSFGYTQNFESIDVFRDWVKEDVVRVKIKTDQFISSWEGKTPGLKVMKISQDAMDKIRKIAPRTRPVLNKWRHQDEAVDIFIEKERGILEMATGTGKTRTALGICKKLQEKGCVNTIIVTTDGTDLLKQWYKHLLSLANEMADNYIIYRHFEKYHEIEKFKLNPSKKILLVSRQSLHRALKNYDLEFGRKTILVHDEVHNLGSIGNQSKLKGLSDNIRYRLGLSATPEREYDETGNIFIEKHLGPVIYKFDLGDAIKRGILVPFKYYPISYRLTREDKEKIKRIYAKKAASEAEGKPIPPEDIWIEIANVHKTSKAKLPLFDEFIKKNTHLLEKCIIFAATREYGDEIIKIVHKYSYQFHTYYTGEDSEVLRRFANDDIKLLITCHRISEGIDIKSIQTVILFSSDKSKLETIQRIGRCLRNDPDNPHKIANVVDFIRESEDSDQSSDTERFHWLKELSKVRPEED